jgi:hypothetical protein
MKVSSQDQHSNLSPLFWMFINKQGLWSKIQKVGGHSLPLTEAKKQYAPKPLYSQIALQNEQRLELPRYPQVQSVIVAVPLLSG